MHKDTTFTVTICRCKRDFINLLNIYDYTVFKKNIFVFNMVILLWALHWSILTYINSLLNGIYFPYPPLVLSLNDAIAH